MGGAEEEGKEGEEEEERPEGGSEGTEASEVRVGLVFDERIREFPNVVMELRRSMARLEMEFSI